MNNGGKVNYRIPIYLNANHSLLNLNNVLKKVFNKTSEYPVKEVVETLAPPNAPNVYHEIGHFMAYYIEKIMGRDALVNCVGNPKAYFLEYQKSAKLIGDAQKAYVFDNDVILGIENLDW